MKSCSMDHARKRRTPPWLPCLYLLLLWLPAAVAGETRETVARHLKAQQLQGAVWSTVAGGDITADAAGVRDARDGSPMRASDRVHVGSLAKTLMATAVLRLVSQGRLALDTPVAQVLPAPMLDNPWHASDPVRVRHLLDHTAGLDDARLSQVFSLRPGADAPLIDAFAGRDALEVRSRPGSRHSYSNTGYTLLGMVIEAVTGARYEAYVDAHLLRPLGMHDSTFAFTTQVGEHADPRLAMGHFENGVAQAAVPTYLRPAGQFTTTAADMGRLARFLMGDGSVDGAPFIDAALLRAMGQPVATEAAMAGLGVGYGLGLVTRDRHGAVGKCHGGSTVGYRAMLCLFPRQQRAFFVAINADIEGADYGRFDAVLIEALQVPTARPARSPPRSFDAAPWEGIYIPAPNRFASFAWLDTTLGFVRVSREGQGLRLEPFQSRAVSLVPVGGPLLRADGRTMASHAVLIAKDGKRVISTGLQSYEQASLLELVPLWASLVAGLLGVAWLLLAGLARLSTGRRALRHPGFVPFVAIVALLLPLPLFYRQSFLQLGELTAASAALAAVTLLLPLAMLLGLALSLRRRPWSTTATIDAAAMLAVLQWTAVLAWWGLLPLRLWA